LKGKKSSSEDAWRNRQKDQRHCLTRNKGWSSQTSTRNKRTRKGGAPLFREHISQKRQKIKELSSGIGQARNEERPIEKRKQNVNASDLKKSGKKIAYKQRRTAIKGAKQELRERQSNTPNDLEPKKGGTRRRPAGADLPRSKLNKKGQEMLVEKFVV